MKTLIPISISINKLKKQLNFSEISFCLKFFNLNSVKFDFKELGFEFSTVKDSVFFQSSFFLNFVSLNKVWLKKQKYYNFFVSRRNFFSLSFFFCFRDFYSFFFFQFFLKEKQNFFLIFFKVGNLFFPIFIDLNTLFMPIFKIFKSFSKDFNFKKFDLFAQRQCNLVLQKNYNVFSVWFYFFPVLRTCLSYFVLKFFVYFFFSKYLFLSFNVNFNSISEKKKNI